jgi:SpoVK/Ycf46/Vps4 family AAA+-type ATPase
MGIRNVEVGGEVRARDQFLNEMDGIEMKNKQSLVYVIGATNKPWDLDEAFLRRFQRRIFVPLPDAEARIEMFEINSRGLTLSTDVDFRRLAELTEGRSGSDIRDIFQYAQMKVVRELFEGSTAFDPTSKPRPITMSELEEATTKCGRTVSTKNLSRFRDWMAGWEPQ